MLLAMPGGCATRAARSDSARRNPPDMAVLLGGVAGRGHLRRARPWKLALLCMYTMQH